MFHIQLGTIRNILVMFLMLNSSWALAGPAADATIDRWLAAFNRHDVDEVVKLYAPDATLLATASPALLEDSTAIRAYYDYLPGSRVGVVLDKRRTVMLGDALVLCMGFYTFTLLNDGNHNPHHARFTMLLVKRGEDWLILHHHSSRRPQPTR